MRKTSLSATDSTGASAGRRDEDLSNSGPYAFEEDPFRDSPSFLNSANHFHSESINESQISYADELRETRLDTSPKRSDADDSIVATSTPRKTSSFLSSENPYDSDEHLDVSVSSEQSGVASPSLPKHQMTPSRESVSSSFKASTTIVAPKSSRKSLLEVATGLTPKSARKTLSQMKSVVASSIRRVYSKEDDEMSRIDSSQHSYIEGESELSVASQSFSAIVTSYTQVLIFNWKTITQGIEKINIPDRSVFDKEQDSELEKMMLSDIAAIVKHTDEVGRGQTLDGLLLAISQLVEAANAHFLKKWMLLFATLRKFLPSTIAHLKPDYYQSIRVFWKSQMLVHTCWY